MLRRRLAGLALAAVLPLSVAGTASATDYPPPPPSQGGGDEGCTPGYWKNHISAWEYYVPGRKLVTVFNNEGLGSQALRQATMQQALSFKGGSTITAAKQILLRAAVAALLNSVDSEVDYELARADVVRQVNQALLSNDRATILALASRLDQYNNAGCPL